MSVRFILGRAGSGKTHRCLRAIADELRSGPEGPPLIFLVPEQATFQMERALLVETGGRAFTRARILSFQRLAHWVFSEAGGPPSPAIGDVQRRLLLRLLLRRRLHDLEVFGRAADQPGFEKELARLVGEFLRQRIDADRLRAVAMALEEGGRNEGGVAGGGRAGAASPQAYLGAKLRDLAMILGDYRAEIEGRFVNPEEAPEYLARALARNPLLTGARLWVDGFASFSAQELHALGEILGQVEFAEICLCLDPVEAGAAGKTDGGTASEGATATSHALSDTRQDLRLFAETHRTYARLKGIVGVRGLAAEEPVALAPKGPTPRFASAPEIAHLERSFSDPLPKGWDGPSQSVRLVEAASPRIQAETTARELARLRRERGYRWRDMAVLSRNLEGNLSALLPALREQGVPCFVDRRRCLDSHPLVAALLSAVHVVCRGWNSTDVIEFLKTGLTAMSMEAVDRVENYVLEHGVSGRRLWTGGASWSAWPRRRLDEEESWEPGETDEKRRAELERINGWRGQALAVLWEWERERFVERGNAAVDDLDGAAPPGMNADTFDRESDGVGETDSDSGTDSDGNRGGNGDGMVGTGGVGESRGRIDGVITGRGLAGALADLIRRLDAAARLEAWERDAREQGHLGRAEEHRQALRAVVGALSQMASVLESERLQWSEIVEVTEAALDGLQIGVIPAGLDEVLLGSVDRSRQPELKACLAIGMAEGEFPSGHAQDPLLTDPERESLRVHGCEVAPPAMDQFLNESYLAYIACTRASEWLWVCRPVADERGEELAASPFWKQLRAIFPDHAPEEIAAINEGWDRVATLRQWLGKLAEAMGADEAHWSDLSDKSDRSDGSDKSDWSDKSDGSNGSDPWDFVIAMHGGSRPTLPPVEAFSALDLAGEAAEGLLRRFAAAILAGPVPTSEAKLDSALAGAALLHDSVLSASLSQIESFTKCPFQHFASYVLGIRERPEHRVELVDLGSLYHAVLSLWVGGAIRNGEDLADYSEDDIQRGIRGIVDLVAPRLKNELLLSNARLRFILGLVKETLIELARTVVASLRVGAFRPRGVEVGFGSGRTGLRPLEFDLPGGRRLRFRGRIDRVDVSTPDAGDIGVCVIDYKMSARTLDLTKVFYGLDLQLGGYLLAVTTSSNSAEWLGGRPVGVGAFYVPVREKATRYVHPDQIGEEAETAAHTRRKMRGLFDEAWLDRLEPLADGEQGVFHQVARKKNGEIGYSQSDCLSRDALNLVLRHIERLLRAAGVAMLDGRIEVSPTKYGAETPCGFCAYAPLCRVDTAMTPFRALRKLGGREKALEAMEEAARDGD